MDEKERLALGFKTRRAVLGDAHVDQAVASTTPLNAEFQDLITRLAWGEIWTRQAIDHPTRRLLTMAMLIALNRGDEFKMHVRAALEHGMDVALIKEVILQSAVYCGVPAANAALHMVSSLTVQDAR
jgi:4-carboxymuconolactone decarboxylase